MSAVYHHNNPTFFTNPSGIVRVSDFTKVATYNGDLGLATNIFDTLETMYRWTQNIDSSWSDSYTHMTPLMRNARSTSVGDIMEVNGEFYEVGNYGFNRVQAI